MSYLISSRAAALDTEIEDFLLDRQVQHISPGTIGWHKHCLGKWRAHCVEHGMYTTEQTTPKLLREFVADLEAIGHNKGGVMNIYRSVKAFLRWYENEYEPANWRSPTRKVKVRVPKTPLLEPVNLNHFRAMAATCDAGTFTGCRDLAILYTLLDSGVRHQELTDLLIGDVNLATGEILVRKGKGGKTRIVFVGATARQALEAYLHARNGPLIRYLRRRNKSLESDAFWLTDQGGPLTRAGVRQVIRRRSIQAGVPQYGLHAFRRAFAINSLRNGMDVITLQRLMGHSSLEVTTRYLKFVTNDLATAHAKFGVVDHLLPHDVVRSEVLASFVEQDLAEEHKLCASTAQQGTANDGEGGSRQQHPVHRDKVNPPIKPAKSARKTKKKRSTTIKYTFDANEGKRPAKLNQ